MTLNGAITQLVLLSEHPMMPVIFRPTIQKVIETISELEAQPEQRWIPVTERLPKFGTIVLITNEKGNVRCGRFRGVEFWKDGGDAYWTFKGNTVEHVLAWMPLPKPWEGETE